MMDGVRLIERIGARGAMIRVLDKPHLDLTTPIGRGFIAFLSAMAEDERERILKRAPRRSSCRQEAGRQVRAQAKAGRAPSTRSRRMVREDGQSLRAVAHHYHVGHSTIVRALERHTR